MSTNVSSSLQRQTPPIKSQNSNDKIKKGGDSIIDSDAPYSGHSVKAIIKSKDRTLDEMQDIAGKCKAKVRMHKRFIDTISAKHEKILKENEYLRKELDDIKNKSTNVSSISYSDTFEDRMKALEEQSEKEYQKLCKTEYVQMCARFALDPNL